MASAHDINQYAQAGAIHNEYGIFVEVRGETVFELRKESGWITFYCPQDIGPDSIRHMNKALEIAGFDTDLTKFQFWGSGKQLVLVGADESALTWINIDDNEPKQSIRAITLTNLELEAKNKSD